MRFPPTPGVKNLDGYDGFWSKFHYTVGFIAGLNGVPQDLVWKVATDYEYLENMVLKGVDGIESVTNQQADIWMAVAGWRDAQRAGLAGWSDTMGLPPPAINLRPLPPLPWPFAKSPTLTGYENYITMAVDEGDR